MAKVYKVWIHVEEIDEAKDHYEECGCPFDMGEFDNEDEAWDYAGELSRSMDETNELMAAARDVIAECDGGGLDRAIDRLSNAIREMEVKP